MPLSNFITQFKDFYSLNLHMNDVKSWMVLLKLFQGLEHAFCVCVVENIIIIYNGRLLSVLTLL